MFRLRNVGQISFVTLCSRISGQLRTTLFAALFSTTALGDILAIAMKIPNLLRSLLAEGALKAVFIPMLSESKVHEENKTNKRSSKIAAYPQRFNFLFSVTLVASVGITLLGMLLARPLSEALYALSKGGFVADGETELSAKAIRVAFPYLIGISLATLSSAWLFSKRKFILASSLPVLQNFILIGISVYAILFLRGTREDLEMAVVLIAGAASVGGLVQFCCTLPALRKHGIQIRMPSLSIWRGKGAEFRKLGKLLSPATLTSLLHQGQLLALDAIALALGAGTVSALFYANRILEFPLAILVYAVLTASFPLMSEQGVAYRAATLLSGEGEGEIRKESVKSNLERAEKIASLRAEIEASYTKALSLIMMGCFGAAFWLLCSYQTVISFVFGFGNFSSESIEITSRCLLFYLFALPVIALLRLLAQLAYAFHMPQVTFRAYAISFPLAIAMAMGISMLYTEPAALALSALFSAMFTLGIFLRLLASKLPFPLLAITARESMRYFVTALVPLACTYPLALLTRPILETVRTSSDNLWLTKLFELGELGFLFSLFLIFYLLMLALRQDKEFLLILNKLRLK